MAGIGVYLCGNADCKHFMLSVETEIRCRLSEYYTGDKSEDMYILCCYYCDEPVDEDNYIVVTDSCKRHDEILDEVTSEARNRNKNACLGKGVIAVYNCDECRRQLNDEEVEWLDETDDCKGICLICDTVSVEPHVWYVSRIGYLERCHGKAK